ncbi:tRNA cytosine(34) acetyltransferase TmcA [Haemophilus paracuniculus]|uniref:tRNA(Met) cytidine acetyltransferase TmcA n=1 Tax=Haemophilus paracuniculus TaxID=734 RepID=A0A1T0AVM8_9PAST|nr:GNAT family N-acetyltransferase [Haemophilus paracuniculus]OOS00636.1 tRNA cytosine(34) acetyltransferase TmcA [Haemophilus paracuniculus]
MRQLVVFTGKSEIITPTNIPYLCHSPRPHQLAFHNAKSLLGREFPYGIYDMRAETGVCLHLEALAIVAGTIQRGGKLILICPEWHNLCQIADLDAERWNGKQAVRSPHFFAHFQQLIDKFSFTVSDQLPELANANPSPIQPFHLTADQQKILEKLPLDPARTHLITAPRGRGKSTLAGKLAEKIAQHQPVIVTARSPAALPSFWRQNAEKIPFFAPDRLISLLNQGKIAPNQWLFIDEAASLPLPILHQLCGYFAKTVLTTTTHHYEGTGRGFSLKFLAQLSNAYRHWTLSQPLRWAENDPLEAFIDQLLLLDENQTYPAESLANFYQLLATAHYKTTPTDLRRLFDAPDQQLTKIIENQQLIAGGWAMFEGGLSEDLTQAIWRGERRPQGNLVVQYLCFQGNLPQACRLRSLRISRLAVRPEFQQKGYGKRLVSQIILQGEQQGLDFVSVSFGLSAELYRFWLACGFRLVQISPTVEASSGYHSAMMIFPLSTQGKTFAEQAVQQFERDFPLLPFAVDLQKIVKISPLAELHLNEQDWQNLHGFATAQRTILSCYASLQRLAKFHPRLLPRLETFRQPSPTISQKALTQQMRGQVAEILAERMAKSA